MSTPVAAPQPIEEAVAAQAAALPDRKRKLEEDEQPDAKIKAVKTEPEADAVVAKPPVTAYKPVVSQEVVVQARGVRLEQNRKAACESRRRKKVMIEELQRSVIFFSRANGTLKLQNDELTRLLMHAQAQIAAIDGDSKVAAKPSVAAAAPLPAQKKTEHEHQDEAAELAQANAVAAQAMYESQGFPAAAARSVAQTMSGASAAASSASPTMPTHASLPAMQPGATMQAMANFQQAAAAAMQAAMGQMQEIPGLNTSQLAAAPAGTNAQQAYTDIMTALTMQQAAASAGQQFLAHPGMQYLQPVMNQWPQQNVPTHAPKPAPSEPKKEG